MFTENTRLELGRQVYLDSLEILSDRVASCTMNGLFDENYSGQVINNLDKGEKQILVGGYPELDSILKEIPDIILQMCAKICKLCCCELAPVVQISRRVTGDEGWGRHKNSHKDFTGLLSSILTGKRERGQGQGGVVETCCPYIQLC